ncbi:MarR family transcriptional regulator, partial [Streptomyces oryzae]|nr:MarR family transcriptional regulator [Streptomyces oryzae]
SRFMDFVGESNARAAEQAGEILHTMPDPPGPVSKGTAAPRLDGGQPG